MSLGIFIHSFSPTYTALYILLPCHQTLDFLQDLSYKSGSSIAASSTTTSLITQTYHIFLQSKAWGVCMTFPSTPFPQPATCSLGYTNSALVLSDTLTCPTVNLLFSIASYILYPCLVWPSLLSHQSISRLPLRPALSETITSLFC